jgi:hypothetical protein
MFCFRTAYKSSVQDDNVQGNGKEREEMKQDTEVPVAYKWWDSTQSGVHDVQLTTFRIDPTVFIFVVWGHHIAALFFLRSILHTSQQHSLAASISVSLPKRPLGATTSETTSAGHQLRYLANGEADQRDYLSRLPTLLPSQWRGRPERLPQQATPTNSTTEPMVRPTREPSSVYKTRVFREAAFHHRQSSRAFQQ